MSSASRKEEFSWNNVKERKIVLALQIYKVELDVVLTSNVELKIVHEKKKVYRKSSSKRLKGVNEE